MITKKQRTVLLAKWVTQILTIILLLFATNCEKKETQPVENSEKSPTNFSSNSENTSISSKTDSKSKWNAIDNPSEDGWKTEALAEYADKKLKKLGDLFFNEGTLENIITSDFSTDPLSPKELKTLLSKDSIIIQSADIQPNTKKEGAEHLQKELISTRNQTSELPEERYIKFKIVGIDLKSDQETFNTKVLFNINYKTNSNIVQKNAVWSINWKGLDEHTKISDITIQSFSQAIRQKTFPLFTEITESVIGENSCYTTQLAHGMNHWLTRAPVRAMLNRFGTPGISIGDVNGDGLDDFFLCQEPGLPNRLFIQQKDGKALELSKEWGVDWIEDSRSSVIADFDNDGDQDLAVACYGMVVIANNNNQRGFEPVTVLRTSWSTSSLAAADYDNDGLIDLYVCAYVNEDNGDSIGTGSNEFVYHDAENGAANTLFKNTTKDPGNLSFIDVTEEAGLNINNSRWSFAASWEDYDNDGDQDLYVANDYGRNNLYNNDNGKFTDLASETDSEDSASGMSVSWADYDRDGNMDLYVSNMFSAAGNRITNQKQFKNSTQQSVRERFRRFARGNTLLRNTGQIFQDTSLSAGVNMGRWAWGSNFIDFNNDTFPDLIVANGYLTSKSESGDL
ncbi:MAG: VCBS repeat-containing protein [Verrucomicrobiota bacterium]|nr:VCBS repeat-containing protein [Verrucomicrobiota bacterium]